MKYATVSQFSANDVINYRGYAATRTQAYADALKHTKSHLSAERMAWGLDIPVLTAEQRACYLPFEAK